MLRALRAEVYVRSRIPANQKLAPENERLRREIEQGQGRRAGLDRHRRSKRGDNTGIEDGQARLRLRTDLPHTSCCCIPIGVEAWET